MSKGLMLCAAILAVTAAEAHAHTEQPRRGMSSGIYATSTHCSPSNRINLSQLQPGEIAIMIQDRGYREGNGSSFDAGECW